MRRTPPLERKKKFRLHSNDFGFICAGVSNVVSYKGNICYNLSVTDLLPFEQQKKSLADFFEAYGVISYGSGRMS